MGNSDRPLGEFIWQPGEDETSPFMHEWLQSAMPKTQDTVSTQAEHAVQVMSHTTDGVVIVRADGSAIYANDAATRMLGVTRVDIMTGNFHSLIHSPDCDRRTCPIMAPLDNGIPLSDLYDRFRVRRTEATIPVQVRVNPLVDGGLVRSVAVVFMDATALIEQRDAAESAKQALIAALRKQQQIDAHKTDFIYSVSHELRTPLTSILGFAEMAHETDDPEEIKSYIDPILRNAQRLLDQVEDLLTVARIESSSLPASMEAIAVRFALETAAMGQKPSMEKKKLRVSIACPLDVSVEADVKQFDQVVTNLISNAVKFSPEGGNIEVSGRTLPDGQMVEVTVTDHGLGIPEAEVDQIFNRFYRTSTARAQAIPGTGLGLVIVKALVVKNGGEIDFTSVEGEYTTFRFTWPIKRVERKGNDASPANLGFENNVDVQALLAEHDDQNRETAHAYSERVADVELPEIPVVRMPTLLPVELPTRVATPDIALAPEVLNAEGDDTTANPYIPSI